MTMHDEEMWQRDRGPGPRVRFHGHGDDDTIRRRRGPGGPPPGGRGPFAFRGRHTGGGWRGDMGWMAFAGFPFGDPRTHRGPRVKRGDVRAVALTLIAEEPRNGYQIIQEIESRSRGMWRPSPGSVYPALQQLEDEGLIRAEDGEGGRKAFHLTDEGRAYVAEHADELRAPWDALTGTAAADVIDMRHLFGQVAMAAMQVVSVGTEAQIESARQILIGARRSLYGILASDEDAADEGTAGQGTADSEE
ncbi:MAG: PadR family transcriptional regulator [Micromonosporaceae bacterium]